MSRRPSLLRQQALGLLAVGTVILLCVLALLFYRGDLTRGTMVTLRSDRSGLLLDTGAKVSVRGIQVGRVKSVTSQDGKAVIELDLDPEQAAALPANVRPRLWPTTLFGAKYVDLQYPREPVQARLAAGDVLQTAQISPETDVVFQNLMTILDEVEPQKINSTLAALSGALGGRGDQLGETITDFDAYLVGLLPSMGQLGRDLRLLNQVLPVYEEAAPDLITTIDNFRVTSATLTSRRAQLGMLLDQTRTTGGQATALAIDAGAPLVDASRVLKPVTPALQRYSPAVKCLVAGSANLTEHPALRSTQPYKGIWGESAIMRRAVPYRYPQDLPVVAEDSGPHCYGLPLLPAGYIPPHYDFNIGTKVSPIGVSPRTSP